MTAAAHPLPPDCRVTDLRDRTLLGSRIAAQRAAFGSDIATVEGHRRLERWELYRRDLDVVIVTGSDEVVAFATAWFDPTARNATIEPVGTVPAHQRRGLGSAVTAEAARRLRADGATRIMIATSGQRGRGGTLGRADATAGF